MRGRRLRKGEGAVDVQPQFAGRKQSHRLFDDLSLPSQPG
jgi:hypothetical protein